MVDAHSKEISPVRILVAENVPSLNKGEMTIDIRDFIGVCLD